MVCPPGRNCLIALKKRMPKNNPIDRRMSAELQAGDEKALVRPLGTVSPAQTTSNLVGLDRFIRIREVRHHTSLSTSTLYRKMRDGTFPQQIELGANTVAWYESEVAAWMQNPT